MDGINKHEERLRREAVRLRHQFAQAGRGVFANMIPPDRLVEVISAECKHYRDRLYPPLTTLRLFIGQVLAEDNACQDVLCRYLAERTVAGVSPSGLNPGAYGQVRGRLPLQVWVTTILNPALASAQELDELYALRWNIEVNWRTIKATMAMDVLRCLSPAMVQKEIAAHLLAYNLARWTMAVAATLADVLPRVLGFTGEK